MLIWLLSSSGPGRVPLTDETPVRLRLGAQLKNKNNSLNKNRLPVRSAGKIAWFPFAENFAEDRANSAAGRN